MIRVGVLRLGCTGVGMGGGRAEWCVGLAGGVGAGRVGGVTLLVLEGWL